MIRAQPVRHGDREGSGDGEGRRREGGREEERKEEKEVDCPRNKARIHRTRTSTIMMPFLY